MNGFKKMVVAGLVAAAALTLGCQRTYDRNAHANSADINRTDRVTTDENAGVGGSGAATTTTPDNNATVQDKTTAPETQPSYGTSATTGAAGQTNDTNTQQDMTTPAYGGSGTAGTTQDNTQNVNTPPQNMDQTQNQDVNQPSDMNQTQDQDTFGTGGSGKKMKKDAGM